MTTKPAVVLSEGDVLQNKPLTPGQSPVYVQENLGGEPLKFYSKGKLEIAAKQGRDIYLVTLLPVEPNYLAWIHQFMPGENVFASEGIMDGLGELITGSGDYKHPGHATMLERLLSPWRKVYARIGAPWPEGCDTPRQAHTLLLASGKAIGGAGLATFAQN